MKKLLIGYDGSPGAESLLEDLSRAGLPASLEVVVLSVADVWLPTNPPPGRADVSTPVSATSRQAQEQALQTVEQHRTLAARAAERLRAAHPGWTVSPVGCGDSPAWALIKKADEWQADLVTVGSHGRSALERLFLGSTSQKVAAEAHCSVRITRPRRAAQPARLRLAVAVDGSPDSACAVAAVAARVWPAQTELDLVTVLDPRLETALAWPGLFAEQWAPPRDQETREAACRILESASQKLFDARLKVTTHLLTGEPRHELLQQAERRNVDAIFLGARGLHHGGRLSLGTLASAVAARAPCTVEIIRPD